jgi:hypothetical protein
MANRRKAVPKQTEAELLRISLRRCCLCFKWENDLERKNGQIAHLDRSPKNNTLANLVWLCLPHHDEYDTIRRQTKSLGPAEVQLFRDELYAKLAEPLLEDDAATEVMHRYSLADDAVNKVINAEISTRIEQICQFFRLHEREWRASDQLERSGLSQKESDASCERTDQAIREKLKLPEGIWGLNPQGPIPAAWRASARRLARNWVQGRLTYKECVDILWVFEELYDFDMHYIIFGLPNGTLSAIQMCALSSFVFEHGQRRIHR